MKRSYVGVGNDHMWESECEFNGLLNDAGRMTGGVLC